MKKVTVYVCEVCGNRSESKSEIIDCEKRGKPSYYPVGLMFSHPCFEGYTFCVADENIDGHDNISRVWTCRNNRQGDSLGGRFSSCNVLRFDKRHAAQKNSPTFKRMLRYLNLVGIPPSRWDGKKAVPIKQGNRQELYL